MKDLELQPPDIQEKIRYIEQNYDSDIKGAFTVNKELMAEASAQNNKLVCGFCHAYFARYYYILGDLRECMSHVRSGIRLQEKTEDIDSLAISYNLLGIDAMNHGEYPMAMEYYEYVVESYGSSGPMSGASLVNIGHIYYEVGDIDKALMYCHRGRVILEKEHRQYSLLIELAQEATYNIWSKRLTKAAVVMGDLEKLTSKIKEEHPEEVIADLYEVRIYYYDAVNNTHERDRAFRDYIDALKQFNGSYIDFSENINWICDTLLNAGKLDFVGELLNLTRQSIMSSGIPYMQLQFLERDIRFHTRVNDADQVHFLESEYFKASCIKNRENLRIYRTNIGIHNDVKRLREEKKKMEEENRRLLREASVDPLTQIANRALLNQKAEYFFKKADKEQVSLGMEMLDVDFFKEFNDTYGHQAGDRCLTIVANILKGMSSENIFVSRYGGDEFMIIYYDMTDDEIMQKAQWIRDSIIQMRVENKNSKTTGYLSVSQGIRNSIPVPENKVWDYMYGADVALYKVKRSQKGNIYLLHNVKIG